MASTYKETVTYPTPMMCGQCYHTFLEPFEKCPICNAGMSLARVVAPITQEEVRYPSFASLEEAKLLVAELLPDGRVEAVYDNAAKEVKKGVYTLPHMGVTHTMEAVCGQLTEAGEWVMLPNRQWKAAPIVDWAVQWSVDRHEAGVHDPLGHTVTSVSVTVYVAEAADMVELRSALVAFAANRPCPPSGQYHEE